MTGISTDDKAKPDGTLAITQEDFSDSWTTEDIHTHCKKDEKCKTQSTVKSVKVCEVVRLVYRIFL